MLNIYYFRSACFSFCKLFRGLNLFKAGVHEEILYHIAIEPDKKTADAVEAIRYEFYGVIGDDAWKNCFEGVQMPLLCFLSEKKNQKHLESMIMYELAGVKHEQMAQLGPLICQKERGLVGFELLLSEELSETLQAIKMQLTELFDVDARYFDVVEKPCLVIAKNLSPLAFDFVQKKLQAQKGFSLGYESLIFGKREAINHLKTIRKLDLA